MTAQRPNRRAVTLIAILSSVLVTALVMTGTSTQAAPARQTAPAHRSGPLAPWADEKVATHPVVDRAPAATVSQPVRRIAPLSKSGARVAASATPTPRSIPAASKFEGLSNPPGSSLMPPDPNGDVSATQYVQAVNDEHGTRIAIYDKATGNLVTRPFVLGKLWARGRCAEHGEGDPIVQYDTLAQRWILSQFAFRFDRYDNPVGPYSECIAVSTTSDATGSYFPYGFVIDDKLFPDYPKFGVWPDGYYMSVHLFNSYSFKAQGVIAFDRENMLNGAPARSMIFFTNSGLWGLLPSDLEGTTPPPAGAPNYLVVMRDDNVGDAGSDRILVYGFFANWLHPRRSHIDGVATLPTQPYNAKLCRFSSYCLPQKGTRMKLDPAAGNRLMYPLVYRNFGDHEALVFQHTVRVGATDHAGINWFEIRDPSGTPGLFQQGTYAPDNLSRWVASIAMDGTGGIAMAYSTTSDSTYPSIAFTGRLQSDTLGQMPLGDNPIVAGGGSQTGYFRWGDYTSLSVDPVDDCTFWYTDEFYPQSSKYTWHTSISSFRLPTCSGASSSPTPSSPAPSPS